MGWLVAVTGVCPRCAVLQMGDSQQLGGGAAAAAATAGGGWGCGEDTSVLDDDLGNWEGSQDSTSSWTGVQRDCWSKTQMRRTKVQPASALPREKRETCCLLCTLKEKRYYFVFPR